MKIVSISPDSELAYFLGFAVGDGSFSHRTISDFDSSISEREKLLAGSWNRLSLDSVANSAVG